MPDEIAITGWAKLGGLVLAARRARGLSQATLAAEAGVARSWLARVEAGHRGAELEPLLRLMDALDLILTVKPSSEPNRQPPAPAPQPGQSSKNPATEAASTAATRRKHTPVKPKSASYRNIPGPTGDNLRRASMDRRTAWGLPPAGDREADRD